MELLLLSTSAVYGEDYLAYALPAVEEWLDGAKDILFVPFALNDHDGYVSLVRRSLAPLGVDVHGAHRESLSILDGVGHIFVGGGNSFRLLKALQSGGWVDEISLRVRCGVLRYMGSSAGTNMACPTIRTTNDMPIVQPATFDALGLVPFQINPHYLDPVVGLRHMGETRETRLREFLEENRCSVLGLREGAWLRRSHGCLVLHGGTARLFGVGEEATEHSPGEDMSGLLRSLPEFG